MAADSDNDELAATIQAQVDEWSTNSNDCTHIELVEGDGNVVAPFQPEFTYPIFGQEEVIFGYQGLNIVLSFAAHNLRPHLSFTYDQVFPAQGDVKPTDIEEAFRDFLVEEAFSKKSREEAVKDTHAADFRPPGELLHEYTREGQTFQIWCALLSDPEAKMLLERVEVLIPMFIEGGSTLQLSQDWTTQRWKVFFLYQHDTSSVGTPYSFVGYGTSYRVFTLPDRRHPAQAEIISLEQGSETIDDFLSFPITKSPLDLPSRERLSQFLVLPPYQGAGHGLELYNTMYARLTQPANVREFTVEDPNEAFDDLRDLCDMLYLRKVSDFAALRIDASLKPEQLKSSEHIPMDLIVPGDVRRTLMAQTKIMQRQFDRMVEAHTLSFIPLANRSRARITRKERATSLHDKSYYLWRLFVKQRLYIFNRDQLAQLERDERVERLDAAVDSVQEGYVKLLEKVTSKEEQAAESSSVDQPVSTGAKRPSKRARIEEDEDEDEDEGGEAAVNSRIENGHKKVRVEQ